MAADEPDATSTPTTVPRLTGRRNIKDSNSVQSPIDLDTSKHHYETRSHRKPLERTFESAESGSPGRSPERSPREFSTQNKTGEKRQDKRSRSHDDLAEPDQSSEGEGVPSDGENFETENRPRSQDESNTLMIVLLVISGVALGMGALFFYDPASDSPPLNIHERFNALEKEFNKQEKDFWRNIKVNIQEIPLLDQPRTIIFLYNNKAESTLNRILNEVSDIALCSLSECSNRAVVIEGASLSSSEIVKDYGKIISKYRNNLKLNGVMIVRNLEKVPGVSAQAFHSFCDDYNPVVKNALILFTMKVETLPEGYPMKFVEGFLSKIWNDIGKDDKFYPLFTRISSTILTVTPE